MSYDEKLNQMNNYYSGLIRTALIREDDMTAARLGKAYDKKVARLTVQRDSSQALRSIARRLTPSRAA